MSAAGPPQNARPLGGAARSDARGEHASDAPETHSLSFDPHALLEQGAAALGIEVPAAHRAAVAGNLARLYALARDILDFEPPGAADDETPAA